MSLALPARSGDAGFLRALRGGAFRGRVHSTFAHVINVEAGDGTLRTLASRAIDNAPDTLIVDTRDFAAAGIEAGDAACVEEGMLAIGAKCIIAFESACDWEPSLPSYPADRSRLRRNLAAVRKVAPAMAMSSGRGGPQSFDDRSSLSVGAASSLARHAADLRAALHRGEVDAACRHGQAMLGLGPGLTPSGDDFLVGLFATLLLPGSPGRGWAPVCTTIVASAAGRTNAISLAALRAAAHGRVRASIVALLRALLDGSPRRVASALRPVLAIGSTSGADIVAGIATGFEVHLDGAAG